MLRPGLGAVFIGINPAPPSVDAGHYYQGRLGKRFWKRLQEYEITGPLPPEVEDDAAFDFGFGFADLVRRPTGSMKDLTQGEMREAVSDLMLRLSAVGPSALIVFVFAAAADVVEWPLRNEGYKTFCLPGPYAAKSKERQQMLALRNLLDR